MKKVMILALSLCVFASNRAMAKDTIRIGAMHTLQYGAIDYMKEISNKYDLKIEEIFYDKGIDPQTAIGTDRLDILALPLAPAVIARAQGAPLYAVSAFSRGGYRLIARNDSAIHSITDMRGKKIGVPRGSMQELLLLAALEKYKLTASDKAGKDVEIVYLADAQLNTALIGKSVDAICQIEPLATQALAQEGTVDLVRPYDTGLGNPSGLLLMHEKLYKEKHDVALRFMKLFTEATLTFIEKPDLAEQYIRTSLFKNALNPKEYTNLSANITYSYDINTLPIQAATAEMETLGMLRTGNGLVLAAPAASDWVKLDLLRDAKDSMGLP